LHFGAPELKDKYQYSFIPKPGPGAKKPLYENQACYGQLVGETPEAILNTIQNRFYLQWLIESYNAYPDKEHFFSPFFQKLCGTDQLEQQIKQGITEKEIRQSWAKDLEKFKKIWKKYLIYPDFKE
jgi:uncharacterized protein YbbC (DUF1343 family)